MPLRTCDIRVMEYQQHSAFCKLYSHMSLDQHRYCTSVVHSSEAVKTCTTQQKCNSICFRLPPPFNVLQLAYFCFGDLSPPFVVGCRSNVNQVQSCRHDGSVITRDHGVCARCSPPPETAVEAAEMSGK
jgi:hypothetical protein